MNMIKPPKIVSVFVVALLITALCAAQFKQILKIVGVGAAVKQFGPDINKAINKLTKHTDTNMIATKVVPIISAGIDSRQAIGAAQVIGPKRLVDKVQAVAQIEQDILGREIKIRAMIPVESKNVIQDIKKVDGVAVSGIVDLKL